MPESGHDANTRLVGQSIIPEDSGHIAEVTLGVTTALLAPERAAFLREFFTNQVLENSDIPRSTNKIRKRISAVSINVCPDCLLFNFFMDFSPLN
jgi:hypothetical protein